MYSQKQNNNNDLLKYASLGTQIFVSLGIAVYIGHWIDNRWIKTAIPIFTLLLPLIVLGTIIYKIIKDTSKRKKDDVTK